MRILKAFFFTFAFIGAINLISCWILLVDLVDPDALEIYRYYDLVNVALSTILVLIFVLFIVPRGEKIPQKTTLAWYLIAALLGVIFYFGQIPLNLIYNAVFNTEFNTQITYFGFEEYAWLSIISSVILTPISEELFFREYIQKDLQKKYAPWLAIFITSICFALIHLDLVALFFDDLYLRPHHAYITFFGSLILGFVYYRSKSIGPAIWMHASWNFFATIF